jgi:hypothetical protein
MTAPAPRRKERAVLVLPSFCTIRSSGSNGSPMCRRVRACFGVHVLRCLLMLKGSRAATPTGLPIGLPYESKKSPYRGVNYPRAPERGRPGRRVRYDVPHLGGDASFNQAPLRCAAPCQSRARAISPPSRYPHLSQAAFAPSARSRCRSSAG